MEILFYVYLVFFWLIFWSFWSVLISRLYSSESWIVSWRSHCTKCWHTLWVLDLFPVFSYIFLFGKCRYCKTKISLLYPILELVMWICFFLVWYYFIDFNLLISLDKYQIFRLFLFLTIIFILVVASFYDILYQLIPVELLWFWIFLLLFLHIFGIALPEYSQIFNYFKFDSELTRFSYLKDAFLGSFVIYSFFYLQILLPWIYYAIEKKKYKLIKLELIEYFTMPIWMVIWIFSKYKTKDESEYEEFEDAYTFMWHWDLWIAMFMGLFLWFKMSILWLALAYIFWSVIWMYILFVKRQRNSRLAFWPFLSLWTLVSLLYYDKIIYLFLSLFKVS